MDARSSRVAALLRLRRRFPPWTNSFFALMKMIRRLFMTEMIHFPGSRYPELLGYAH